MIPSRLLISWLKPEKLRVSFIHSLVHGVIGTEGDDLAGLETSFDARGMRQTGRIHLECYFCML